MVACYTWHNIYPDYFCALFRNSYIPLNEMYNRNIHENTEENLIRARAMLSRKTSRNNEHNSMSLACASLINYSSQVIEAFANSVSTFVRRGWRRVLLCGISTSYSRPVNAGVYIQYIYIYIYIYTRANFATA